MNNFLSELSRRHVIRVGGAYVVVGWAILQAASIIAPAMDLPDSAITFILFVLMLGFPVAIFLAWAFQVTPEGVKRNEMSEDVPVQRVSKPEIGLIVAALILVGASIYMPGSINRQPTQHGNLVNRAPALSVAIVPFDNLLGDAKYDYLVEGFVEDLTTKLAKTSLPLVVAGRNSASAFGDTSSDIQEIGDKLNVRYVVEGSLRRNGDNVRVTGQLIDITTNAHVWGDAFDYPLADLLKGTDVAVFEMYPDIEATLLRSEIGRLRSAPKTSLSAGDLALMGFAAGFLPLNKDSIPAGMNILRAAIALDPNNATALWVSAMLCSYAPGFHADKTPELMEEAITNISRALELDPMSSSIASAAALVFHNLNDQDTALRHASRAVALDPENSFAHNVHARTLLASGQAGNALESVEAALDLISPKHLNFSEFRYTRGLVLLGLADFVEAEEMFRQNLLLTDNSWNNWGLLVALAQQQKLEQARAASQKFAESYPLITRGQIIESAGLQGWQTDYIAMLSEGLRLASLD